MLRGTSLFGQVLNLIPRLEFASAVRHHQAEHAAKGFTCWDQFVAMLFCQLAQAKSLREICGGLASCAGKIQPRARRDESMMRKQRGFGA